MCSGGGILCELLHNPYYENIFKKQKLEEKILLSRSGQRNEIFVDFASKGIVKIQFQEFKAILADGIVNEL